MTIGSGLRWVIGGIFVVLVWGMWLARVIWGIGVMRDEQGECARWALLSGGSGHSFGHGDFVGGWEDMVRAKKCARIRGFALCVCEDAQ